MPLNNAIRITTDDGNTGNVTVTGNVMVGGQRTLGGLLDANVLFAPGAQGTVGQIGR
jgi:hypothetical protein